MKKIVDVIPDFHQFRGAFYRENPRGTAFVGGEEYSCTELYSAVVIRLIRISERAAAPDTKLS